MKREIVRCPEGYWNMIDERGKLICRFQIGDVVDILVDTAIAPVRRTIDCIMVNAYGILIETDKHCIYNIQRIVSMEVIKCGAIGIF